MQTRRYGTLDGMRGIAALCVMIYHVSVAFAPAGDPHRLWMPSSYLAVDLFFALSGFVLSHGYDARLSGGMTAAAFMRARVVRLYPVYWLGVAIGLVDLALDVRNGLPPWAAVKAGVSGALMLPSPTWSTMQFVLPANPAAWSLFQELFVANLLFGALNRRLRGLALGTFIAAALVALLIWQRQGSLDGGWDWSNVAGGFVRVAFSFFVGVALHRLHGSGAAAPRLPAAAMLLILALTFAYHPAAHLRAYELACVGLIYPALIWCGATAFERQPRLGRALGNASYAIYALHYQIAKLLIAIRPTLKTEHGTLAACCFVPFMVLIALAVDRYYDPPVRRALARLLPTSGGSRTRAAAA